MRSAQPTRPDVGFQMEQGGSRCSGFNGQPPVAGEQGTKGEQRTKQRGAFPGSLPGAAGAPTLEGSPPWLCRNLPAEMSGELAALCLSGPQARDFVTSDC